MLSMMLMQQFRSSITREAKDDGEAFEEMRQLFGHLGSPLLDAIDQLDWTLSSAQQFTTAADKLFEETKLPPSLVIWFMANALFRPEVTPKSDLIDELFAHLMGKPDVH